MPLLEVGAAAREQAIKREEREAGAVQIKKERLDDAAEEAGRASVGCAGCRAGGRPPTDESTSVQGFSPVSALRACTGQMKAP